MPTSMPIRLNIVAMRPDSTSVRPSSSRSPGRAGAHLGHVGAGDQAAGEDRPRSRASWTQAAVTGIFSSTIFFDHSAGPVLCTDVPFASTATVTGMSFTSNS